jgi:UDP-N-acetylmuramate: L-alanyl-gamma-D-glutamyl-meso-diaminopimelate ligase
VLEPRSNTLRRNIFEDDLVDSLTVADEVVLAAVFKSESIPSNERLHPEEVTRRLAERGIVAVTLPDAAAIVTDLAPRLERGDVVAILSNGGFGDIYHLLPEALSRRLGQDG